MKEASSLDEDLEAFVAEWTEPLSETDQAIILSLSPAKRQIALTRAAVLRWLTKSPRSRFSRKVEVAAFFLGIGTSRMRGLLREWRESPSLAVIAPHAIRRPRKRPALPAHQIAARLIEKALARSPQIAEPSISARITAVCARLGLAPPARMTVRSLLNEARRTLPSPAALFLGPGAGNQKAGECPVLVDQYFKAMICIDSRAEAPAQARLLIDASTGFIIAAGKSLPSIAHDASHSFASREDRLGPWKVPRTLFLACKLTQRESRRIKPRARALGIQLEFPPRRQIRRWTDTLLRAGFENLKPSPPPTGKSGTRADWPRLTPSEFEWALAAAVAAHRKDISRRGDNPVQGGSDGKREYCATLVTIFDDA